MFRESTQPVILSNKIYISSSTSIIIWFITVLFTIFQLLLEMLTNTMTDSLMQSFNTNHIGLGILSSAFFYSFLLMQIPAGYLLDKINNRLLLSFTCFGCSVGCVFFSYSANIYLAFASRLIMGAFASFGFLGILNVSLLAFNKRFFPLMIGISQFIVMACTAIFQPIFSYYIQIYSWREVLRFYGIIGFCISSLLFIFLKKIPLSKNTDSYSDIIDKLLFILKTKQCWLACLYGFGMFSTIASFSALWGMSYLKNVYALNINEASVGVSFIFWGVAVGCVTLGFIVSYFKIYATLLRVIPSFLLVALITLMVFPSILKYKIDTVFFMIGILSSSYFLAFDIVKSSVPPRCKILALAFCNIFVMLGTIILQPLMGLIIDFYGKWYPYSYGFEYRASLLVLVFSVSISLIMSIFIKNKLTPLILVSPP